MAMLAVVGVILDLLGPAHRPLLAQLAQFASRRLLGAVFPFDAGNVSHTVPLYIVVNVSKWPVVTILIHTLGVGMG